MKPFAISIIFLALSFHLLAQPTAITWQGKLLDSSGNAINQNNVSMNFAMFDTSTGGTQLWPASGVVTKTVDVVQGLYSVQLGTGTGDDIAFTAAMFNGHTPWLEVKVGTATLPRTEITTVPFALISSDLSAAAWETPGEIGKTTPNTGKFTSLETGNLKVTNGASNGKVLTSDADGNTSWTTPYTGLTNFTESNFSYDSKTGVKFTPDNAATDVDFVLQPKGNGAVLTQQPDGTTAGGNKRGNLAVDLQLYRLDASQVASGIGAAILGGGNNTASGFLSTAMGYNTIASGSFSTAMGYYTKASTDYSTAMGKNTTASGPYSTAMGAYTIASGSFSTSSGYSSDATDTYSIAMGRDAQASNEYAVAIGNNPIASGYAALAMGDYTTASGRISTAMGNRTTAPSGYETVFGRFNTDYTPSSTTDWIATDRLFVVGNGDSDVTKSNAITVLKNANTTVGGSLTVNGNGTNNSVTFPATRGTSGQVLKTDGNGSTSWGNAVDPGTAPGQMQYWNGTAWVTVVAGQNGQILKFRNNAPIWEDDNINNLSLGDFYKGGFIAYFLQAGDPGYDAQVRHGIIAAPNDLPGLIAWGCEGTEIPGAHGDAVGTGMQNTLAILDSCSAVGIAAQLCNDLVINGFDDWFLPSRFEMYQINLNKDYVPNLAASSPYYWTSSEYDINRARAMILGDGSSNKGQVKSVGYRVRPVRSF